MSIFYYETANKLTREMEHVLLLYRKWNGLRAGELVFLLFSQTRKHVVTQYWKIHSSQTLHNFSTKDLRETKKASSVYPFEDVEAIFQPGVLLHELLQHRWGEISLLLQVLHLRPESLNLLFLSGRARQSFTVFIKCTLLLFINNKSRNLFIYSRVQKSKKKTQKKTKLLLLHSCLI